METIREGRGVRTAAWKGVVFLAVGLLFLGWLLNTPAGLLGKADAVGYAVCHRIDLRSFHLGIRQMPFCARCTGMFAGALLGLAYQAILAPRRVGSPPRRVIFPLAFLVLAFSVDGLNSFANLFPGLPTLYPPSNTLRLITGTGMGLAIAATLYPAFNLSAWRRPEPGPALEGVRSLAALGFLALLLDLLVLSENPLALYPLALASAFSAFLLLTLVYTLAWLTALRLENRCESLVELALPLAGGFALGLLQIALFDLGRFLLTGTWEGFRLG